MKAHSAHDNERVGDIVLAIDHNGKLYENEGHVCGSVDIRHKETKAFTRMDDFLESVVEGHEWKPFQFMSQSGGTRGSPSSGKGTEN